MTAIGVPELSADRVVHRIQKRHEHTRLVVIFQQAVNLLQHFPRLASADDRTLEQGAGGHHKQGGGYAFVRNVGNSKPNATVRQMHYIEEVAPDVARRLHAAKGLKVIAPGEIGGKN